MKKIEINFEDAIQSLKAFKEFSLGKQKNDNFALSDLTEKDLVKLYSNLEKTKSNLVQLRALME